MNRADARAIAGFVPDCVVLSVCLLRDPRVPLRQRVLLAGLAGYLVFPLDLVPDFLPIVGQLDDAVLVALVVRRLLQGAGEAVIRAHWPGPEPSLRLVLAAAGGSPDEASSRPVEGSDPGKTRVIPTAGV